MRRVGASLGVALVLAAGCGTPSPSTQGVPDASGQPAARGCPAVDLRGPSGSRVDLNGIWRANDFGRYDIQQNGSCVYWLGQSQEPGAEPGSDWTNVFVGTIRSDFTIEGRWGDVPYRSTEFMASGDMTLRVDFDDLSGDPVLHALEVNGEGFTEGGGQGFAGSRHRCCGFGGTWVLERTLPAATEHVGILGASAPSACAHDETTGGGYWLEADGQRYEFYTPGTYDLFFRLQPLGLHDAAGYILFRPGDAIRVVGQVAPALGSGCEPSFILATEVKRSP